MAPPGVGGCAGGSPPLTLAQPRRTIAAADSERYTVSPLMVWSPPETAAPVRLSVQRTGAAAMLACNKPTAAP